LLELPVKAKAIESPLIQGFCSCQAFAPVRAFAPAGAALLGEVETANNF